MPQKARRVPEFAQLVLNVGSATRYGLFVGDSHSSYFNNGNTSQRYINGLMRTWPITLAGWFTPAGSVMNSCVDTPNAARSITTLSIGATQHPTDGCVAPHELIRHAWTGNEATDSLIRRVDWTSDTQYIRGGNALDGAACLAKVHYYRRTNSLTTCRMRAGYTTDSYTTDSTRDLSGAAGIQTVSMAINANAGASLRWDCFTGGESENTKELTFVGTTFQMATTTGGTILAAVGNGGTTAADYDSATTIAPASVWQSWSSAVTGGAGFDWIVYQIGSNMTAGESAAITTVWRNNVESGIRKIINAQRTIGNQNTRALLLSGFDFNNTSRLASIASAMDDIAANNPDISFIDTAAVGPNLAEASARWTVDPGVDYHRNNYGSQVDGSIIAGAMQAAYDVPTTSARNIRNWR